MGKRKGKLEEILDTYLTRLQGSDVDLDIVLDDAAQEDASLRQLLIAASRARQALKPSDPDDDFVRTSEIRVLNRLRAQQKERMPIKAKRSRPFIRRLRTAPVIISLIIVVRVLSGTIGVASAAASSLPGDGLYPLKLGMEDARLALTLDPEADFQLLEEFADERLSEIEALVEAGRVADIDIAMDAYGESIDRLITDDQDSSPSDNAPLSDDVASRLDNHVEVLTAVLSKVPPQAQAAIQNAIDRSSQARNNAEKQEEKAGEREDSQEEHQELQEAREEEQQERQDEREDERDLRTAEQIARKHEVTMDDVLGVYEGICERDWICVRAHFRNRESD